MDPIRGRDFSVNLDTIHEAGSSSVGGEVISFEGFDKVGDIGKGPITITVR